MLLLALDTCFGCCSAAVYDAGADRVVAERHAFMERGHAEAIAPMVQSVLQEAGIAVKSLGRIAVTTGPGTFTGLRIGVSLAQGLALANATPLVGLNTMAATAAPLFGCGQPLTVCHKAGATGQYYVAHFDAAGTPLSSILLCSADEIAIAPDAVSIGTGAGALPAHTLREPEYDLPVAAAFARYAATRPVDHTHAATAVYFRGPDAKPQLLKTSIARVGPEAATVLSALHATSFADGWRADAIVVMLEIPGTLALIAQIGAEPVAMLIARAIGDEAEILTLATSPRHRRRGIARHLLQSLESHLRSVTVKTVHLEAASDNAAALGLYGGFGYARSGLRKAYYATGADAVVMRRILA